MGRFTSALEVAVAESSAPPTMGSLRTAWRARLGGRATPLLLIVLHDRKAALCGPGGEQPLAFTDLNLDIVERLCATALEESDRHSALRFLRSVIPQLEPEVRVPGLWNEGLFATHELQSDVPRRKDWADAVERARNALRHHDQVGQVVCRIGEGEQQTR